MSSTLEQAVSRITHATIEHLYDQVLGELLEIYPISRWRTRPQRLKLSKQKSNYGMADSEGTIHINVAFLGTQAHRLLEQTLRHEFAHLAAGLRHKHNSVFQAMAERFGVVPKVDLRADMRAFRDNITYKYHLYAELANGETHFMGGRHRMNTRLNRYKPSATQFYTVAGHKVLSFSFMAAAD